MRGCNTTVTRRQRGGVNEVAFWLLLEQIHVCESRLCLGTVENMQEAARGEAPCVPRVHGGTAAALRRQDASDGAPGQQEALASEGRPFSLWSYNVNQRLQLKRCLICVVTPIL